MNGTNAVIPEKFEECPHCANSDKSSWLYDFQQCVSCGYSGIEFRDDRHIRACVNALLFPTDQIERDAHVIRAYAEMREALKDADSILYAEFGYFDGNVHLAAATKESCERLRDLSYCLKTLVAKLEKADG